MCTLAAGIPLVPLEVSQVLLTVQIRFKAFAELQKVLTLKNVHKIPGFSDIKDMKLSTDLYNFLLITNTFLDVIIGKRTVYRIGYYSV